MPVPDIYFFLEDACVRRFGILAVTISFSGIGFAQTQDLILPVSSMDTFRPPIHYQTTVRIVNLLANPVQVTFGGLSE